MNLKKLTWTPIQAKLISKRCWSTWEPSWNGTMKNSARLLMRKEVKKMLTVHSIETLNKTRNLRFWNDTSPLFFTFIIKWSSILSFDIIYIAMKSIRMSKKNPSKILKIIDGPHSQRYTSQDHSQINQMALGSTNKTSRLANIYINKEQRVSSPSHSHRVIDFGSL